MTATHAPTPRRRILTFHGLGVPTRPLEPGEDRYWIGRDPFQRLLDAAAGAPNVEITFDDGNRSDLEIGAAALAARGMTGTFFVVADRIGRPGFLDAAAMHELLGMGMRIGSHGLRHVPWSGLPKDRLEEEVFGARDQIQQAVGRLVDEAACPFGAYDRRSLAALRNAGFRRVLTSDGGTANAAAWIQPRTSLRADDTPESTAALLRRPGAVKDAIRNVRGWIKRWR